MKNNMSHQNEINEFEIQANKFSIKAILYCVIAIAAIWVLDMVNFFVIDKSLMTMAFVFSVFVMLIPLFLVRFTGFEKPWVKYCCIGAICATTTVLTSILSYHAILVYFLPLIMAVQYRNKKVLWMTYTINIVCVIISSLASFYLGMCDLNILFQSGGTISYYVNEQTGNYQNLFFNENPFYILVVYSALPKAMVLFVFVKIMRNIADRNEKEAIKMAEYKWRKEYDLLTRVYNKNKYEEMVEVYYPSIDRIAVLFWDLNCLKEINDQYGHAVGDKIIRKLASCIYAQGTDRSEVYRFGGDEFVMIIENPLEKEAERTIAKVSSSLKQYKENDIEIIAAAGYAYGVGSKVRQVVEEADAGMYINKKEIKLKR